MATNAATTWQGSKWIRAARREAIHASDGRCCTYCEVPVARAADLPDAPEGTELATLAGRPRPKGEGPRSYNAPGAFSLGVCRWGAR